MAFICDSANICNTVKSTFKDGKILNHGECVHNEAHDDSNCSNRNLCCSRIAPKMARCIEVVKPVEVVPVEEVKAEVPVETKAE